MSPRLFVVVAACALAIACGSKRTTVPQGTLDPDKLLFERGTAGEQQAAALALAEATDPEAARLLELHAPAARDAGDSNLMWERLAIAGT